LLQYRRQLLTGVVITTRTRGCHPAPRWQTAHSSSTHSSSLSGSTILYICNVPTQGCHPAPQCWNAPTFSNSHSSSTILYNQHTYLRVSSSPAVLECSNVQQLTWQQQYTIYATYVPEGVFQPCSARLLTAALLTAAHVKQPTPQQHYILYIQRMYLRMSSCSAGVLY
jgi:hypothetical protein